MCFANSRADVRSFETDSLISATFGRLSPLPAALAAPSKVRSKDGNRPVPETALNSPSKDETVHELPSHSQTQRSVGSTVETYGGSWLKIELERRSWIEIEIGRKGWIISDIHLFTSQKMVKALGCLSQHGDGLDCVDNIRSERVTPTDADTELRRIHQLADGSHSVGHIDWFRKYWTVIAVPRLMGMLAARAASTTNELRLCRLSVTHSWVTPPDQATLPSSASSAI